MKRFCKCNLHLNIYYALIYTTIGKTECPFLTYNLTWTTHEI